jgi:hypothetical protein
MKALNMAMASTLATKQPLARTKRMQDLKGGVGSKLLDPVQIEKLIKQKQADKERRAWEKVLGLTKSDPRKSRPKRPTKAAAKGASK